MRVKIIEIIKIKEKLGKYRTLLIGRWPREKLAILISKR